MISKIVNHLIDASSRISSIITLVIACIVFVDVLMRSVFGISFKLSVEICMTLLVAMVFLSFPGCERENGHFRVEIVDAFCSPRQKFALDLFGLAIAFATTVAIFYYSLIRTISSVQRYEVSFGVVKFPIWPARLCITIGLLLLTLTIAVKISQKIADRNSGVFSK